MVASLQFALQNSSDSNTVYAYIDGLAIQNGFKRVFVKADSTLYYPENPPAIGSPLAQDCAIPLGAPGNTVRVTVPQLAGARLWFSRDSKLNFLLNPGPALVEPSVLNPSDPNANINFGFCEFTLNDQQFYGNISYVDFVPQIPIGISLKNNTGAVQTVTGMPANGINNMATALRAQAQKDGRPWDKLIVERNGSPLRILNATHAGAVGANFDGYYEPYVNQVWQKYKAGDQLKLNTQAGPGVVNGTVNAQDQLVIDNEPFGRPSTADIFGCNSGPFTTGANQTRNAIIPRLAAGFVRSTLVSSDVQPSDPSTYYKTDPTNHYARIVHENNVDGKGYAFAYDDVTPDGGADQSGKVNDGAPVLFTATVGGASGNTHAAYQAPPIQQQQKVLAPPAQAQAPAPTLAVPARPAEPQPSLQQQQQKEGKRKGGLHGVLRGLKDKLEVGFSTK